VSVALSIEDTLLVRLAESDSCFVADRDKEVVRDTTDEGLSDTVVESAEVSDVLCVSEADNWFEAVMDPVCE